jgi:hypothetical protein
VKQEGNGVGGRRKPRLRWMDVVELESRNIRALDRTEWASCIREAMQKLKRTVVLKKKKKEEWEKEKEVKKKGLLKNS